MVGAGMAGLAAARALLQAGVEAVVLEARSRPGGRIWTDPSLGVPVDLGASWIHGVDGNPIADLARHAGLATRSTDFENTLLVTGDGEASADAVEDSQQRFHAALRAAPAGVSVQEAVERALHECEADEARRLLQWQATLCASINAADARDLSLDSAFNDGSMEGDNVVFPGGYAALVEWAARGLDVRTGQPVARIQAARDGVDVWVGDVRHRADCVIVTVPLGVLQAAGIAFDPPLPVSHQAAIRRLGMGVLDKVALRFERAFWPARDMLVDAVDSELPGGFFNLHRVNPEAPILVRFVAGRAALRLEAGSDEAAVEACLASLRRVLGWPIPDPESAVVTRWGADPWARGSYSYVPVGVTAADYDALVPVADRIFFAGEATHREYPGTVHGAWLSGERAGRAAAVGVR